MTDSLLFSWDELFDSSQITNSPIGSTNELRLIENDLGIHSNQYTVYSQPKDTIDSILDPDYLASMIDKVIIQILKSLYLLIALFLIFLEYQIAIQRRRILIIFLNKFLILKKDKKFYFLTLKTRRESLDSYFK